MNRKQLTNRLQGFKARVQEEAGKVLRNLDLNDKRIFEKRWAATRRSVQLWSEIANGW